MAATHFSGPVASVGFQAVNSSGTVLGEITSDGTIRAIAGTVSLPGISFYADTDSGMYRIGANNIGVAVNAAKVLDVSTTGLGVVGTILNGNGAVGTPAFSFTSDPNTGIYRIGADNLGVACNGAKVLDVATTGLAVTGTLSATGAITPTGGVAAGGGFSFSPRLCHTGGMSVTQSTDGTELTITNTELYVAEVKIEANCTVTGAAVFWGATTDGNAKVMLFDSAGNRLAISASTDISGYTGDSFGTRIAFSAPYAAKGPATYYVGVICDTNTNTINTHILGNFGAGKITGLVYATEAGYATITPPTTFTTGLGPIATLY